MRVSLRQMTRHGKWRWSAAITSVKRSGMPTGEPTSSAAPFSEKLRIVQSKVAPPNVILPAFKNRRRGAVLCSSIMLDLRREQGSFRRPKLLSRYRWRPIQPYTTHSGGLLWEFHQFKGIG